MPNEETKSSLPSYLQRILDNMPVGGDGASVYAVGYGWACEYPDGSKELLEELPGLLTTLRRYGLDKFGQPLNKGDVVETNLTVHTLNLLGTDDLELLGKPLGIQSGDRKQLISLLTQKLGIK